ncbi:MAG: hypothetical protein JSS30_03220 [Verrucomicrobia bacterium]|nr:hypothetical protein [Verrucomicrobiota bacterium]
MTNPVTNPGPAVQDNYGGYPVARKENPETKKVEYSLEAPRFFYRNSTLSSAQAQLDADVKAVEAADAKKIADKKAADEKAALENAKTPVWKLVVFFPFYLGKFVLGTVASLFSKCCALFGYGKKAEEAAKPEPKPAPAAAPVAK